MLQLADGRGMIREHKYWREKGFKSLDFAEIQFGSKEQQEGEGEKPYCKGIFSRALKCNLSRNRQHEARRPEANQGAQLQQIPKPG